MDIIGVEQIKLRVEKRDALLKEFSNKMYAFSLTVEKEYNEVKFIQKKRRKHGIYIGCMYILTLMFWIIGFFSKLDAIYLFGVLGVELTIGIVWLIFFMRNFNYQKDISKLFSSTHEQICELKNEAAILTSEIKEQVLNIIAINDYKDIENNIDYVDNLITNNKTKIITDDGYYDYYKMWAKKRFNDHSDEEFLRNRKVKSEIGKKKDKFNLDHYTQ